MEVLVIVKVSRRALAIVAGLTLAGTTALPVWAFEPANYGVQAISAEFVPTREQVQAQLKILNDRLETGRKASFYSSEASGEYLEAERYYKFGRYDEALAHAEAGERALPDVPNWVTSDTASR
jgi:hypothetical protein